MLALQVRDTGSSPGGTIIYIYNMFNCGSIKSSGGLTGVAITSNSTERPVSIIAVSS
ncbi:hypothetical protein J6590_093940 [Homalodisca vitripennis]|nr:hypothetical protein J6590_093940 [Homalodisca vitripennis]